MFADVQLLDTPIEPLTYKIPEELEEKASQGCRVLIPVGRQYRIGIILGIYETQPSLKKNIRIRKIKALLDEFPIVPLDLMHLCKWVSDYYFYPLGLLLKSILPETLRTKPKIFYRWTEKDGELPEALRQKLGDAGITINTSKEISRYTLIRKYGLNSRILDRLEKKGFLERIYKFPRPATKHKQKKIYRLLKKGSEIKDSRFNKDIYEAFIREGNRLEGKQLRKLIGKNANYWIKKWEKKGWIEEVIEYDISLLESNFAQEIPPDGPKELTPWQNHAFQIIKKSLESRTFQPFLLYGVTGSGKTEIYLKLCESVLELEGSALILVPEIALITQMEALFKNRFGEQVALWHSGLDAKTRHDQWLAIRKGDKKIVVGTRSAVFSPLQNCLLIVVDEEHDSSYKQEDRLRYSARDIAVIRAQKLGIPVVLGSATPSIQSYHNAIAERYKLLILPERIYSEGSKRDDAGETEKQEGNVCAKAMPAVEIIDMRKEPHNQVFSRRLKDVLIQNFEAGYQSLLFLNRRGYSNCALCPRCGFVMRCEACSVAMTYHIYKNELCCHYCGLQKPLPDVCPSCEKSILTRLGYGTEKVEHQVKKLLPEANILRIDRDSIENMRDLVDKLNCIRKGEAHIIIGTQMLAKGHDFPLLNLTAVINADMSFNLPDFRAGEITAQLIFQVSGRPGRRPQSRGKVIIQTYTPSHYIFDALEKNKYEIFCDRELQSRRLLWYPPFNRMTRVICSHRSKDLIHQAVYEIAESIGKNIGKEKKIVGPAPAPLFKLRNLYRWQFIFRTKRSRDMTTLIEDFLDDPAVKRWQRKIHFIIDRDPYLCL